MWKNYLFINFFYTFNIGRSAHLYVKEEKSECLLIATADANTMTDEEFYTPALLSTDWIRVNPGRRIRYMFGRI